MQLRVRADTGPLALALRGLYRDQLPFATAQAINRTLIAGQAAQREQMGRGFNLRRRDFAAKSIKIRGNERASKRSLEGIIRVETPGGGARSDIFTQHEDGGEKKPFSGTRLAVPQAVLRTKVGIIPRGQRPRAHEFSPMGGKTRTARHVYRGKNRTWMLRNPDGTGGIWQRTGARSTKRRAGAGRRMASERDTRRTFDMNMKMLFRFTETATLDRRLNFEDTVTRTARETYPRHFAEEFAKAIKTAR